MSFKMNVLIFLKENVMAYRKKMIDLHNILEHGEKSRKWKQFQFSNFRHKVPFKSRVLKFHLHIFAFLS